MVAYDHSGDGSGHDEAVEIPEGARALADEYHDKLMDVVSETSDELMERYLEGDEITREEMAAALKKLVTEGELFPVGCGAATRNIGFARAARPDRRGPAVPGAGAECSGGGRRQHARLRVQDGGRPVQRQDQPHAGVRRHGHAPDSSLTNNHSHTKERIGQLLQIQGKDHTPIDALGPGSIGAVAKLKETGTGDVLSDADKPAEIEPLAFPAPVVSFAIEPRHKGEEDKVYQALRRLSEEDPALDIHRDPQTGEMIVAGLSQMHVEVDRRPRGTPVRRRGRPAPAAGAVPRDDSQSPRAPRAATRSRPAGAASSATATSRSSRWTATRATSSSTRSWAA